MTDDLVKRLRERNDLRSMTASIPPQPVKDWLCHSAADRIEQLEAALREIVEKTRDAHPMSYLADYFRIARAALAGEKKDG